MSLSVQNKVPALVLGGSGYVAGELLRLLLSHPLIGPISVVSDSSAGAVIAHSFPHLAPQLAAQTFISFDEALRLSASFTRGAIFCAAPHGVSANLIERLLQTINNNDVRIVDISADHRFRTGPEYARVYGSEKASDTQLAQFTCALPEHLAQVSTRHVAHPGCFASAMLLSLIPLLALDIIQPEVYISGITGSTGSGRTPSTGTHHPDRHSDLYAYKPLAHRHAPEVEAICQQLTQKSARVHFVPHSGPFARGIHTTLQAKLKGSLTSAEIHQRLADFYAGSTFVRISEQEPHIKHVAASNFALIHASATAQHLVVLCALDNLTKGAAGGAIQWMNRLQGFPEQSGLTGLAAGWT